MTKLALILALFLLLAACGGTPPVVVTPPVPPPVVTVPPPAPYIPDFIREKFPTVRLLDDGVAPMIYVDGVGNDSIIRPALDRAAQQIRGIGRTPRVEGLVVVQFRLVNCRNGIFVDDVMDLAEVEQIRRTYPNSFVDGKPCVNGFTEVESQPSTIYVASTAKALQHEFLHFLWWSSFPGEACRDGSTNQVWRVVEHGGDCDPFGR